MSIRRGMVRSLSSPTVHSLLQSRRMGPAVNPPPPAEPFAVIFGDAELTIVPQTPPAAAGFSVAFGDGSLSIAV